MGESRALNIPRLGDVYAINTGDGVFTGREPHTSHQSNELSSLLPTQETTGPAVGTEMVFHERTRDV